MQVVVQQILPNVSTEATEKDQEEAVEPLILDVLNEDWMSKLP
jgi:hypothetical protein